MVIVRRSALDDASDKIGKYLRYSVQIDKSSMFNTPPVFAIYVLGKVLKWMKKKGGLEGIEREANRKASLLYNAIDGTTTWDRPAGPNDVIVDDTEATEYGTDYGTDYASGYDTGDASGYESAGGGYDEDPDWVQYFDEEGNAYMSQTSTGEYYYL